VRESLSKKENVALWEVFQYVSILLTKLRQRELNQYDITLRTSGVLKTIIKFGEETTLLNIARELGLETHSIAAQIGRMEKEGLVEKTKDRKKRNLMHVRITDKGYEKLNNIREGKSIDSVMSVLTDEEQQQFWEILIKLRKHSIIELSELDNQFNPLRGLPVNLKDYVLFEND
jgi:DNA-binding MarR family transcriptional regulator